MGTRMQTTRNRRNAPRWGLVWVSVFLAIIAIIVSINLVFRPARYYLWYPFAFGWIWVPFGFFFLFLTLRWFFWPWGWSYQRSSWTGGDAYEILRERFARGEITNEQFERMTRDLNQNEIQS